MYKIIHIHNDIKFIDETAYFDNPLFKNEVVIFGKRGVYKGKYKETAQYLRPLKSNIGGLIKHCNEADLVVMYNLCPIKSYIANRLAANIKIAWRFFGHELYKYDLASQQSDLTKEMLKPDKKIFYDFREMKELLYQARNIVRNLIMPNNLQPDATGEYEFKKVINRADFFLWHYKEEHEVLKKRWPNLPQFMQTPTIINHIKLNSSGKKQHTIIIGNSKNPLNNHFDILNSLLISKHFHQYQYMIPFSYGKESNYANNLIKKIKDYPNITLLEKFLPMSDYALMFCNASAFVMNSYRQRALGNILIALQTGVKVYLNKKNIIFSVLTSRGFWVYTIEQFWDDLENNNVIMNSAKAEHNVSKIKQLGEKNSVEHFHEDVLKILRER